MGHYDSCRGYLPCGCFEVCVDKHHIASRNRTAAYMDEQKAKRIRSPAREDGLVQCNKHLKNIAHQPYPRTCKACKLGPCKYYREERIPMNQDFGDQTTVMPTVLNNPGPKTPPTYEPDGEALKAMCDNIVQSRSGGRVERCHGLAHQGSYSNAMHQWGVAMLMWYIWPEDFPRLALHCLTHDVPEAWVGDIPAPTMRYVPGVKDSLSKIETNLNRAIGLPSEFELSPDDYAKLKACDRLEFWLWSMEQVHLLGNRFAAEGLTEVERFFTEVKLPERADWTFKFLKLKHSNDRNGLLPTQAGTMQRAAQEV